MKTLSVKHIFLIKILAIISLTLTTCKKDDLVINERPDLVGIWIYDHTPIFFIIYENGDGLYKECPNIMSKQDCDVNIRGKVFIDDNIIRLGRFGKKIKIGDKPPGINSAGNLTVQFDDKEYIGCRTPGITSIDSISSYSAIIQTGWDIRLSSGYFTAYYKPAGNNNWDSVTNVNQRVKLTGLLTSTLYEIKVKSICVNKESVFYEIKTFTTN